MTTTAPRNFRPIYDNDGSVMHYEGPSIHVDGLDLTTEFTEAHGVRILMGSSYVTLDELVTLRYRIQAICEVVKMLS